MTLNDQLLKSHEVQEAIKVFLAAGRKRPLSVRELSRRMKYSSDRAIGMVYSGSRSMSEDMLKRFSKIFSLTEKQQTFLRLLIEKQKVRAREDLSRLNEIEEELQGFRATFEYEVLSPNQLKHLEAWYNLPLLRLISHSGPLTLDQLEKAFDGKVSLEELRSALQNQIELGKMTFDGKKYKATSPKKYVKTQTEIPSTSIRNMHRAQLDRAKVALDEQSVLDREFSTFTIPIDSKKIARLKKRIHEAIWALSDELVATESTDDTEIYQLSLQFFRQLSPKKIQK